MGVKGRYVLVAVESIISGSKNFWIRGRNDPKVERLFFDPVIRAKCIFRETKKIRGKASIGQPWTHTHKRFMSEPEL